MRRSGAPSQQYGNVTKKPRFVAPGSAQSSPGPRPELATKPPQLMACNTINQVPKSLPEKKCEAPVLSNALAKILNAVPLRESKENCTVLTNHSPLPCNEEHHPEEKLSIGKMNRPGVHFHAFRWYNR